MRYMSYDDSDLIGNNNDIQPIFIFSGKCAALLLTDTDAVAIAVAIAVVAL